MKAQRERERETVYSGVKGGTAIDPLTFNPVTSLFYIDNLC